MSEGAPGPGLGQGSIGTSFQCCPVLIRTAEVEHQTGGRRIDIGKEKQGSYRSGVRRSHSAGLLAEQFQRLLLDDPHAPIHRFLDRNKAQQFYAWSKDYGKLLDAGLLFADQLPDEILPSGMRCMVWNSLLTSRRAGGISDQVFLFDPGRAGVLSGEFFLLWQKCRRSFL